MIETAPPAPAVKPAGVIRTAVAGPIGRIVIDNPPRLNALSMAMWLAIPDAVARLIADPAVRVILLCGAGDEAFASGADISEFAVVRADSATSAAYEAANAAAFAALRKAQKPTVAVIRGVCMGGGVGLAVACDLRIAAADAVFAIPAARLGLAYPPEAIGDIVALIGPAETKRLFFTADRIDAAAALRIGLVGDVVDAGVLAETADALALRIAALAPLTHGAVKAAVDAVVTGTEAARLEAHRRAEACFASADYAEGRAAFKERRAPRFEGQ